MNTENEKKWFVYIVDHHEGPFTPLEVNEKMKTGIVTAESFVWSEGMTDWISLSQATDLAQTIERMNPKRVEKKDVTREIKIDRPEKTSSQIEIKKEPKAASKVPLFASLAVVALVILSFAGLSLASRFANEGLHARLRPTLQNVTQTVPLLAPYLSLTPHLNDIKADEIAELEKARLGSPATEPHVAIALSQADSGRPSFYVSTNMPDGTVFNITLNGNSETLLNRLGYTAQNSVTTRNGFGKSEVFLSDGGQLNPKGEYQVVVTPAETSDPSLKLTKTYFLGGPRDEIYLTRLKQFHTKIIENANRELLELKQYTDTLTMQFNTLTNEFGKIYKSKKVPPNLKQLWNKDAETWKQINSQLEQTVQTWSPETLQNEFFYGKVYGYVKSAYDSIRALFTLENNYVQAPQEHNTFDIEHGKAVSEANQALEFLKTKMDAILKAPKTPSGLPTKEGL